MSRKPFGRDWTYWSGVVAALAALAFGSWVRLVDLGQDPLLVDELIHHFVAEGLESGRGGVLPSGEGYFRGREYSELVRISRIWVEDTELAARLPSALLGVAGLVLFGAMGWAIGGPWVAFLSTLLLGVFPQAITEARRARFYTEQLLFLLVALFGTWRVLAEAGTHLDGRSGMARRWLWPGVVLASLGMAFHVQMTTGSIVLGAGSVFLVAAGLDLRGAGWRRGFRKSPTVQLVALGVVAGLLASTVFLGETTRILSAAFYVPVWARSGSWHLLSYYWSLSEAFPLLVALGPFIFLGLGVRDWRLATLLFLWFAVPLAIHTFMPLRNLRYVIGAVPALLMATAVVSVQAVGILRRSIRDRARSSAFLGRKPWRWADGVAIISLVLASLFVGLTRPSVRKALKITEPGGRLVYTGSHGTEDWEALADHLEAARRQENLPVGTADGLASLLYGSAADFVIQRDDLDVARRRAIRRAGNEHLASLSLDHPDLQGLPDRYSGRPLLTRPDFIRQRFSEYPGVYVVVDNVRWSSPTQIDASLKETLLEEGVELCQGACGSLRLFRWRFQGDREEGGDPSAGPTRHP